jgi:hypothetical protein
MSVLLNRSRTVRKVWNNYVEIRIYKWQTLNRFMRMFFHSRANHFQYRSQYLEFYSVNSLGNLCITHNFHWLILTYKEIKQIYVPCVKPVSLILTPRRQELKKWLISPCFITEASNSGGPTFKFCSGDWLTWLRFSAVSSVPPENSAM